MLLHIQGILPKTSQSTRHLWVHSTACWLSMEWPEVLSRHPEIWLMPSCLRWKRWESGVVVSGKDRQDTAGMSHSNQESGLPGDNGRLLWPSVHGPLLYDVLFAFLQSIQLLGHKFMKYPFARCFAATSTRCTQPSYGPTGCLVLCSPRPLSESGIFCGSIPQQMTQALGFQTLLASATFTRFSHADGWLFGLSPPPAGCGLPLDPASDCWGIRIQSVHSLCSPVRLATLHISPSSAAADLMRQLGILKEGN